MDIIAFDLGAAEKVSEIQAQCIGEVNSFLIRSLFIVFLAQVNKCVSVIRNVNHFKVSGLRVDKRRCSKNLFVMMFFSTESLEKRRENLIHIIFFLYQT